MTSYSGSGDTAHTGIGLGLGSFLLRVLWPLCKRETETTNEPQKTEGYAGGVGRQVGAVAACGRGLRWRTGGAIPQLKCDFEQTLWD